MYEGPCLFGPTPDTGPLYLSGVPSEPTQPTTPSYRTKRFLENPLQPTSPNGILELWGDGAPHGDETDENTYRTSTSDSTGDDSCSEPGTVGERGTRRPGHSDPLDERYGDEGYRTTGGGGAYRAGGRM